MQPVNPQEGLGKLQSLVGEQVVLLPLELGSKGPKEIGWQKTTFEQTQKPWYQKRLLEALYRGGNVGVVLGRASGNLCTIDIDMDAEVEPFLALNPKLASTLRTNGANGCQVWIRVVGDYPERVVRSKLKVPETKKSVAEWRGGGGSQSVIQGKHPTPKVRYRFAVEVPAVEIFFDEIIWPERWKMSFDNGASRPSNGGNAHDVKTVELTPEQRERVLRYLDTVDIALSGQGGSDPTYRFANVLLWGFALTIEQARTFMLIYSAKCKPPWSMAEIEHKLADALKADQDGKPRGYLWGKESVEDDDDGTPSSWIPKETLDVAKSIDKPIVFTEGQANGEALLKAGAFPVGLQGMRLKLRTELAGFVWEYRRVYLSLQPQGKKDRWLEIRAWILLRLAGAEAFQLASWPPVEGNWKEFLETLDHRDIDALKSELCRIKDRAKREELAGKVARKLKLPKGALIGDFQEPKKDEAAEKAEEFEQIEPWPEPVSLHEAFSGAVTVFRTFMFMTEAQIVAVALWCATTFLYDLLQIHAYLGITAPTKRCGKTTLVNLVALFVRQGLIVAGRVSAAYIYRAIDRQRPTFIVDESQAIFRKSPDVEDIFNAGHVRSTAYVGLVEKVGDEFVEKRFNVFCPKVIGLKGKIHDDSLQDRVLEIRLSRIHESDQKEDFWDVFGKIPQAELFIECRRKFVRAVMDCAEAFKNHEPELPTFSDGRLKQNWKPLWILAELADQSAGVEYWCNQLAEAIEECEEEALSEPPFQDYLMKSLKDFCEEYLKRFGVLAKKSVQRDFIPTDEILSHTTGLNADKEAPWMVKGEGLSPERLARELRGFKVKKIQRLIQGKRSRGYSHRSLQKKVFKRYTQDEK